MNYLKIKLISVCVLTLTLTSCEVSPKKINYGQDHCAYCDMTVVDKTHASEYVTNKGKSYVFDSIECMLNELKQNNTPENNLTYILVSDFSKPGSLIDAKTATYLISSKIKSPMRANLSAFASRQAAITAKNEFGGKLYNWEQIKNKFDKK